MQHQFGFLQRDHNRVNQGDMMDFYETSVAAHPHILSAIRLHKNATLFADRLLSQWQLTPKFTPLIKSHIQ